jgi:hypothetical protein
VFSSWLNVGISNASRVTRVTNLTWPISRYSPAIRQGHYCHLTSGQPATGLPSLPATSPFKLGLPLNKPNEVIRLQDIYLTDIYLYIYINSAIRVATHFPRNRDYWWQNHEQQITYHIVRECQYDSLELRALECKTLGNHPVDFIVNIHNRQRELKSRVSGIRTNYRLSYHFPINPNTSSNYAGLKYGAILKPSISYCDSYTHLCLYWQPFVSVTRLHEEQTLRTTLLCIQGSLCYIYIEIFVPHLRRSRHSDWLRAGWPGFSPQQWKIFLSSPASRPTLGPTYPVNTGHATRRGRGVKRQGRVAYYSPPSSAQVKKNGPIPPLPHVIMA